MAPYTKNMTSSDQTSVQISTRTNYEATAAYGYDYCVLAGFYSDGSASVSAHDLNAGGKHVMFASKYDWTETSFSR